MIKRPEISKAAIILMVLFLFNIPLFCQELTVIANGVLNNGIDAVITGNNVRVRTGPSLEYKIITKVNKETRVFILERDNKLIKIGKYNNYWYKVKIKSTGKAGWIYGAFLKANPKKATIKLTTKNKIKKNVTDTISNYLGLQAIGNIKTSSYSNLVISGDLNSNGTNEIIFLQKTTGKKSSGRYSIAGYELIGGKYNKVYNLPLNLRNIKNISLIKRKGIPFPMLIISDERSSQIYIYDKKRKLLRAIYRLNSEFLTIALIKDIGPFLVYTNKNRYIDYDGSITYYIFLTPLKIKGDRFSSSGIKIKYNRPLPIKKLITFDINSDGSDEIIAEIGGQNHGGGIVILSKNENGIQQIINSGLLTYNSMPFIKIWGTIINGQARLAVYTTNPSNSGNVNTEFGLLFFSFVTRTLITEAFYRVNKMLDDINNFRIIIPLPLNSTDGTFLIADYDKKSSSYSIKKPIF